MKLMKLALAAALMSAAASASAQVYGELDYNFVTYKDVGMPDAKTGMLGINLGYDISKNLAVEGRVAFNVADDTVWSNRGFGVNVKVNNTYGFYLKPKFSPMPNLEVFAKIGYMHSKVSASVPGLSASDSDSDLAYGAGVQYGMDKMNYVTGSYTSFYDKDGAKLNGWSVGFGHKF